MTTCVLVLGIITCVSTAPRLTPAEAAAILAPHQFVYVAPVDPLGPQSFVIRAKPPKRLPERTRLDGTPLWLPPRVYGLPPFYPYPFVTGFRTHSGGVRDVQRGTNAKPRK